MTEAEIMKALECCKSPTVDDCAKCPMLPTKESGNDCLDALIDGMVDLLNRKNAEIEELKSNIAILKSSNINLQELYQTEKEKVAKAKEKVIGIAKALQTARAEAIKEFAERVKKTTLIVSFLGKVVCVECIDQIAKEMGVEL